MFAAMGIGMVYGCAVHVNDRQESQHGIEPLLIEAQIAQALEN